MDFNKNRVLKENYTFLVSDADVQVRSGEHGLYHRDTRYLSRYQWSFGREVQTLLQYSPKPDVLSAYYAWIDGPAQVLGFQRELQIRSAALIDRMTVQNTSQQQQQVQLRLELASDFADLFEARGWHQLERHGIRCNRSDDRIRYHYRAQDGVEAATEVQFSLAPSEFGASYVQFVFVLEPNTSQTLTVHVQVLGESASETLDYRSWRQHFELSASGERNQEVLEQAIMDLRALLLFTDHGPIPAAGIPWFVAAFGRDALLTASMLLPWCPEVAEGTLHYLAAAQGVKRDPFRAEEPGKIMHERRFGELTRLGHAPHAPYYGTVDATPLFVTLLHDTWRHTKNLALVETLRPHWEAALEWTVRDGDLDGDGFLEFVGAAPGQALSVQSWKDSGDSMSHADGRLAEGALAVSEVQGYAYAAYQAAADFYQALGEPERARVWATRAAQLQRDFQQAFWLPDMNSYAMALDGEKRPLKVHNSDAGQLLWSGIVPEEIAPSLVETLMSDELWSGWGIRTLGKSAARYNPVSYHNGSVWPHDNALIAGGMARYGFHEAAARIRDALYDLAASQWDKRLPELIAGYERSSAPPVPYPTACRPQAWDAAALLYLLRVGRDI